MFDIGFSELLVIAVVALVVLGPERLPKAARFAGLWVRRARNQWDSVKQELERELHADEIKRQFRDVQASVVTSAQPDRVNAEARLPPNALPLSLTLAASGARRSSRPSA